MWSETGPSMKYGVAIYNYKEDGPHRMKLSVGDTVHIVEQCEGWLRGYNLKNRYIQGIFPQAYVCIKDASIDKSGAYESLTTKEPMIVQEITSVLREWGSILRNLYVNNGAQFEEVRGMMSRLLDARKVIMSRKLTMDELKDLQQKLTAIIDMGNAILGLDLAVRDEDGNILNPELTGTIKLFRQHELAMERIEAEQSKNCPNPVGKHKIKHQFSLFVSVKNFVCRIGEDADVLINLYDAKENKVFTESYIINWGSQGLPKDIEMLNNLRALFTDLGTKDLQREKVFLVCQIIRIGCMDLKDADNKKQTTGLRRPFGVAVMDLSEIFRGNVEASEDKPPHFIPFMACGKEDSLEKVIRNAIQAKEINHKGQGLWVCLQILPGDLNQVKEDYPHLVAGNTSVARKMGFPEVIMPGDVRNDLYVTIMCGEFIRGNKTSDKNVEVTICVCNERGDVIKDVISHGSDDFTTDYRSVIYYHKDKPEWYETVKVAIPIEDFYGSHLKFTFKHRSTIDAKDKTEKPFAMAFVKLMNDNGTTLADKVHDLCVYKEIKPGRKYEQGKKVWKKKIDNKKQDKLIYLSLPASKQDLEKKASKTGLPVQKQTIQAGPLTFSNKDSFQIETLVCSTKLTHNLDLMGLLKWRDNPEGLKEHLQTLMKVDGEEVVKFLQDTLDALFNILMQNSDSDLYDQMVFDALVFIIDLISNRKYHQFRPVMEVYIEQNFSATLVYNKLMVCFKYYVDNAQEGSHQDALLKALKSLEYIFKFIIRSRQLFATLNENRGNQQFEVSLKQLLQSINHLMKNTADNTVLVQGAALRYLPTAIFDVIKVFDSQELSHLLVEFINNVPKERLTKEKIKCILAIVHSRLFMFPDCRYILLPMVLAHTKTLLESGEELEEVVKILGDLMELLTSHEVGPVHDDLSMIVMAILRTVIQTVITMPRERPCIGNYVALMTAMLRQMTEHHYVQYINHFPTLIDLTDFLMEILMVFRDLVSKNVYPSDWNEMIMMQNSVFLKALRHFSHTIRDRFSSPFEYQLWNNFFHCAISFLTQEPLQLENFSTAKRNKIISRYKDMRRETGFEIRSMWFNLGQYKIRFIPEMVGPILEMTLIPETELRKATIPIFFDMMLCEFMHTQPSGRIKGSFVLVENEMITQLDALVEGGRGDEQYRDLFFQIMYGLCDGHSYMKEMGTAFVETVQKLMQRLLEYRTIIHDENKENRMSCIVNLLNFYHDINRQEMYIRYLHKLCDLHLECDNYTEAAYTLLLYSMLLTWSDDPLPNMLQDAKHSDAQTNRALKEKLYYDVIHYFDKGKMWEKGIELCKELAKQCENETFDYIQLAKILGQEAEFYTFIMNQMRPEPEYFRVGFYGKGFPSFLQNKVFIYRGKEYERLSDFTTRLQNQFPNAQLMKTLTPPGEDILESDSQYLQINAVTPILEPKRRFQGKSVSEQILRYYKVNEVQKFTYSRRMAAEDGTNEFTSMWLERTNLVTSYPLPGILRWFPVASTYVFEVSPLENAIETVETANAKIEDLTEQHMSSNDPKLRIDPLSMVINGVVDPAVNGGITRYKIFYSEEYLQKYPQKKTFELVSKLKEATTQQVALLETAITVHGRKAPDTLKPFHAHLEMRFTQMKDLIEKELGIKVKDLKLNKVKVKRIQTLPPQSPTRITLDIPEKRSPAKHRHHRTISPNPHRGSPNRSHSTVGTVRSGSPTKMQTPGKVKNMIATSKRNTTSSDTSESSTGSMVIELNEQLTPKRPLRPNSGHIKLNGKPLSVVSDTGSSASLASMVNSVLQSNFTNSGDSEEPPPLPEKQAYADYGNIDEDAPPLPVRKSGTMRASHKDKPQPPLPLDSSQQEVPPNPPKKPDRKTTFD
ncbi:LOW QUALITY PROTEIN: dedicator of cytokinesis protein 1-like [Lingula anatina]|uniref:LOW QUALITY PROTEIN: dedicator of cytokinesis protein 1-like n=1 Tax=Lingula anatina TaxID=7574 RepID=A0A1S3GZQ7_LINAN|nr:LOW QUALITY PROTEIN: dedicator of cytokinesis protein 1-like [Lingula anatina]|eukprot:XP_013378716.1 LOW QUALITY PROTEIN: dedicator of cytokinesis protein 1-like [Lingula anatina]